MIDLLGKQRRSRRFGKAVTLIAEGCTFEGELRSEADLRIEGEFKGGLHVDGEVAIGEKGCVRSSNLQARDVTIAGRFEGRVEASGQVRITSTGRLLGTVKAAVLMIEQGAHFQGKSEMNGTPQEEDAALAVAVL